LVSWVRSVQIAHCAHAIRSPTLHLS
jgi:hypothetical protein